MTRRVTARLAAGLAGVALLLAGCTGEVPQPEPDPTATTPFPVLDRDRMERILEEVGETIAEADAELDPELLSGRVTGPALAMRTAEYRLAEASEGERTPTPVSTASQVEAVAATDQWPRAVFVISHVPDDANLPLLLVLKQQDARSPYQLWYWTTLLPGVQTPSTAHIDSGSPQLAPDAEGLVLTPAQTLEAYAGLLGDPSADSAELFTDDPFRTGYTEMIEALRSTVEVAGEVEVDYSVQKVAELWGRRPGTVRDWIRSGRLEGYLFNREEYRVPRAALERFLEEQRSGCSKARQPSVPARPADLGAWRDVRTRSAGES